MTAEIKRIVQNPNNCEIHNSYPIPQFFECRQLSLLNHLL